MELSSTTRTIALALAWIACAGCKASHKAAPPSATPSAATIPRISGPIKIDGEWTEPDWSKRALRGQFLGDDGQLARPSSEVRLLRDDTRLYVGLYAADDNIQSTDAFELEIGTHRWTVDAVGRIAPPIDGASIALDRDGTLDDPANNDEEWVIEMSVPLAMTGLVGAERTTIRAARCDTPKHQITRCGAWAGPVKVE